MCKTGYLSTLARVGGTVETNSCKQPPKIEQKMLDYYFIQFRKAVSRYPKNIL